MTFDAAFDRLFVAEGGYVNDPNDPGGETNFGISKRSYPNVDIKGLTRDKAKAIYLHDFWDPIAADALPPSVQFQLLDFAVNSGISTAIRYLQRAVGVADDGVWGPISRDAAILITPTALTIALIAERLDFMTRCANWPAAGRGWAHRIAADLRYAVQDV